MRHKGPWLTLFLIALMLSAGVAGLACEEAGLQAGAESVGDPEVPSAGNGGYEALHYEIMLGFDPGSGAVDGLTTIACEAKQDLRSFNLDLSGLDVSAVTVDGRSAEYQRKRGKLIVACPETLVAGAVFSVGVAYSGKPEPVRDAESFLLGWRQVGDYVYTLDEPLGAATWYPVNDHPSDKATYTFRITVPKPLVAVANGVLVETIDQGRDRTFT
ncbi:MAG: hypothetical protein JW990_22305 [Thermoleophilia bacterium]|nr:hypothetical protein [Thermoleophilia bacterium]